MGSSLSSDILYEDRRLPEEVQFFSTWRVKDVELLVERLDEYKLAEAAQQAASSAGYSNPGPSLSKEMDRGGGQGAAGGASETKSLNDEDGVEGGDTVGADGESERARKRGIINSDADNASAHVDEMVPWKHYFLVTSTIEKARLRKEREEEHKRWHPACQGYALLPGQPPSQFRKRGKRVRIARTNQSGGSEAGSDDDDERWEEEDGGEGESKPPAVGGLPADYTDDEPSEDEDDEEDEEEDDDDDDNDSGAGENDNDAGATQGDGDGDGDSEEEKERKDGADAESVGNDYVAAEKADSKVAGGAGNAEKEDSAASKDAKEEKALTSAPAEEESPQSKEDGGGDNKQVADAKSGGVSSADSKPEAKKSLVAADENEPDGHDDDLVEKPVQRLARLRKRLRSELLPHLPDHQNPALLHPCFWNRDTETKRQTILDTEDLRNTTLEEDEGRVVRQLRDRRAEALRVAEEEGLAHKGVRRRQLEALAKKYQDFERKRRQDLDQARRSMQDPATLRAFEKRWMTDSGAMIKSNRLELQQQKLEVAAKNREENARIEAARQDLEYFNAVEEIKQPVGVKMEKIARQETERCNETLEEAHHELEAAEKELNAIKKQANKDEERARNAATSKGKKYKEGSASSGLRSVMIVAEGRVEEARRVVESAEADLRDAGILTQRAKRTRKMEAMVAPVFGRLGARTDCVETPRTLLVAGLVAIAKDAWQEKFRVFLDQFSTRNKFGMMDMLTLTDIVHSAHTILYRLGLLPRGPDRAEIHNMAVRALLDRHMNPLKDCLTLYETRVWLHQLVSRSAFICKLMGVAFEVAEDSTFMRHYMHPLTLYQRQMIGPHDAAYAMHLDKVMYNPATHPDARTTLHERALAMGKDDPLKPDYSKFVPEKQKKKRSNVVELRHGMAGSLPAKLFRAGVEAVVQLQGMYRGYKGRQRAEGEAQKDAFLQAKKMAMDDVQKKVEQEFEDKEAMRGVDKMKWDASLRMKQAKLHATGQQVTRNDVLEMMIREAVTEAHKEVEVRFAEIAREKGYTFEEDKADLFKPVSGLEDVQDPFQLEAIGQFFRGAMHGVDEDILASDIRTPRQGQSSHNTEDGGAGESKSVDGPGEAEADSLDGSMEESKSIFNVFRGLDTEADARLQELAQLSLKRQSHMLRGEFPKELYQLGVALNEKRLREELEQSDPDTDRIALRLRALSTSFSDLKVEDMLRELPSKRLLLRFVRHVLHHTAHENGLDLVGGYKLHGRVRAIALQVLAHELEEHFGLKRESQIVAKSLVAIADADAEFGTALRGLEVLRSRLEGVLRLLAIVQNEHGMVEAQHTIERKRKQLELAVAAGDASDSSGAKLTELPPLQDQITEQMDREKVLIRKRFAQVHDLTRVMDRTVDKLWRAQQGLRHSRQMYRNFGLYRVRVDGEAVENMVDTDVRLRTDWMDRFHHALSAKEETLEDRERKFLEMRSVCNEFLEAATRGAEAVVREMYTPNWMKTARVAETQACDGRAAKGGRGLDNGKTYVYELEGILFELCIDAHGVFNGSDEFAAKAGGHALRGSLEYFKLHSDTLHVPFTAAVDVHGFRVLATAKAPTKIIVFNDSGEVRTVKETLLQGMANNGETIVSLSKAVETQLAETSELLNLAPHFVKGTKDLNAKLVPAAAALRVHLGSDDNYYLSNFGTCFPAEDPECTPHLPPASRGMSVEWRQLRPELVKWYDEPLSPDAMRITTAGTEDWREQHRAVREASEHLVRDSIPAMARDLSRRNFELSMEHGLGLDLTNEFHQRGLNMRHLGLLRSKFWRKLVGTINVFYDRRTVYTSRDMRDDVVRGTRLEIRGLVYRVSTDPSDKFSATKLTLDRPIEGYSAKNLTVWAGDVEERSTSEDLRTLILAEMAARTIKNMVRLMMRAYVTTTSAVSSSAQAWIICEHLNIVTGNHERATDVWSNQIFHGIRQRFGTCAVALAEQDMLYNDLQSAIPYMVTRLRSMLGFQLENACNTEFYLHPTAFQFLPVDLHRIEPRVKHNISVMDFAEASLLTDKANVARSHSFVSALRDARPTLYWLLHDRKGTLMCNNVGSIGADMNGRFSTSVELEAIGPISTDNRSRGAHFTAEQKSRIDARFHPFVCPTNWRLPFTVTVWAKVTGGTGNNRVVIMNGRFSVAASREEQWVCTIYEGLLEVSVIVAPVVPDKWTFLSIVWDGMTLYTYADGDMTVSIETARVFTRKQHELDEERGSAKGLIENEEAQERAEVKHMTEHQASEYFRSKEGMAELKEQALRLVEEEQFRIRMDKAAKERGDKPISKPQAVKKVKQKYITDLYMRNVKHLTEKFEKLRDELDERYAREDEEGRTRAQRPFRVGGAVPDMRSREGRFFFEGDVAHVAVFNKTLTGDTIRSLYRISQTDRSAEADRLYALSAHKYQQALDFAPDDPLVLQKYAESLCRYLEVEVRLGETSSRSKRKVSEAIKLFSSRGMLDGIAQILKLLPGEEDYSDLACFAFNAILERDRDYFQRTRVLPPRDLVHYPLKFTLIDPTVPEFKLRTAASMFREVLRELSLSDVYGDVDLHWLVNIRSPVVVVTMVMQAYNGRDVTELRFGDSPHSASITDDDVKMLVNERRAAGAFDLAGCHQVTDEAILYMNQRCTKLRVLTLDKLVLLTDVGLETVPNQRGQLEVLSLAQCSNISDTATLRIVSTCHSLRVVNFNGCPLVSDTTIVELGRKCGALQVANLSGTKITDQGLHLFAAGTKGDNLHHMDISFCRDVGDHGIAALCDRCVHISHLNVSGVNKITEQGAKYITHKLWKLTYLNMEDLFLVSHRSFAYDRTFDGRPDTKRNMLKELVELNLSDCTRLSDGVFEHINERCRKLKTLMVGGCANITDGGLESLLDPGLNEFPLSVYLTSLNMSYMHHISQECLLRMFELFPQLTALDLSGCIAVSDHVIHRIVSHSRRITHLGLSRCTRLTDRGLCNICDYLWLAKLDISHCTRITDEGIEVLATECSGMTDLNLRRLYQLTDASVRAVARHCDRLRNLDIRDISNIAPTSLLFLRENNRFVTARIDQEVYDRVTATEAAEEEAKRAKIFLSEEVDEADNQSLNASLTTNGSLQRSEEKQKQQQNHDEGIFTTADEGEDLSVLPAVIAQQEAKAEAEAEAEREILANLDAEIARSHQAMGLEEQKQSTPAKGSLASKFGRTGATSALVEADEF